MRHSVFTSSCVSPLLLFSSVAAAFGNAGQAGHARVTLAHNLNRAGVEVVLAEARDYAGNVEARGQFDLPPLGDDGQPAQRPAAPLPVFEPSQSDDDDLFLVPPAPAPLREGELGGELGRADGGRTEGYWASLMDAPDRLRASDLNEVLQPDHLDRLRFTNFPLQAHGMMFKWETLVDGALDVYRRPWQLVAEENNLRVPDDDEVMRAVGMRPERAIQQTFMWTDDWGQTQQLAFAHFEAKVRSTPRHSHTHTQPRTPLARLASSTLQRRFSRVRASLVRAQANVFKEFDFVPQDGIVPWLTLLQEYHVPCCLCAGTALDRAAIDQVLDKSGLSPFFESCVALEDGCETTEQTYLVGSIKLRRPPNRCVAFEDSPKGVVAAHEASLKAVALMGAPGTGGYGSDLRMADMRISAFDDLSLMSLRELFKDAAPIQ